MTVRSRALSLVSAASAAFSSAAAAMNTIRPREPIQVSKVAGIQTFLGIRCIVLFPYRSRDCDTSMR